MNSSKAPPFFDRPLKLKVGKLSILLTTVWIFIVDFHQIFDFSFLSNKDIATTINVGSKNLYRPDYDYEADHKQWDTMWGRVQSIILLGERHSGTTWITDHLTKCFAREGLNVRTEYYRFKHWFQYDDPVRVPPKSAIVISMFRDPYDWVWAMKERPHHAHDHIDLPWLKFVTKPWIGKDRGAGDRNITQAGLKWNVTCIERYAYVEIIPCSEEDSPELDGYGSYKYELQHDGSERSYPSIVDLRRAKIENHLSVSSFEGTRSLYPFRYEDLDFNGTETLLNLLERATGVKRKCSAAPPGGTIKHKKTPKEYMAWMDKFVDWEVEARIGYTRRVRNIK